MGNETEVDLPASLQLTQDNVPPVNPTIQKLEGMKNHKRKPAKGKEKSCDEAHLRHSIGKQEHVGKEHLSSYTISSVPCIPPAFRGVESLTLSHEVLEMVPLDIVRKVTDVDSAVLLGRFADVVHHLFSSDGSLFVRSLRGLSSVSCTWSSTWCTCASHGRAITVSSIVVPAS